MDEIEKPLEILEGDPFSSRSNRKHANLWASSHPADEGFIVFGRSTYAPKFEALWGSYDFYEIKRGVAIPSTSLGCRPLLVAQIKEDAKRIRAGRDVVFEHPQCPCCMCEV